MRIVKEVLLVVRMSLKLLLKDAQTVALLLGSFLLLTVMLLGMDDVKEEKSKIVIGMVNEDGTALAETVIEGMKQKDMYEVVTGEEKHLVEQVKSGSLAAVCILKKGYAENIRNGKSKHLVTVYEAESGEALLLGDILAGVMMQEICTAKSYQMLLDYEEHARKKVGFTPERYHEYVNKVQKVGEADFFFDIEYVDGKGKTAQKPSQAILYEQAIFAVFALMTGVIAIYSVLPFRQMRHGRMATRLKTLPVCEASVYVGSAVAGIIIPSGFGVLFLLNFSWQNPVDFSRFILLLICTMLYSCVIVCMMLLAAYGIRNHTVYQMGMLAMILIFGIFGLVSLVDGLLVPEGTVGWVPNGWYVRKMTELLHQ